MDRAHRQTDSELNKLEKRIQTVYSEAAGDLREQSKNFFRDMAKRERRYMKTLARMIERGEITDEQAVQYLKDWRLNQIRQGQRFGEMSDALAERAAEASQVASAYINDFTPSIYSLNRNYASRALKRTTGAMFQMFDEATVRRLIVERPDIMPYYNPKPTSPNFGKDIAYGKRQITASVTSGILQGKPIGQIADDMMRRITDMGRVSAIRAARTATTSAENAGRMDSYTEARKMGIRLKKQWMATLDERTRDSHREVDGETVDIDMPFSNGLMYPGDPNGAPREVYNCRCTMIAVVEGSQVGNRRTWHDIGGN